MSSVVRSTALRAGGACVRCRKGKTKCVYENGRAPCKNCAKGMHECYLPSESMGHGGHHLPPRVPARSRESLTGDRTVVVAGSTGERHGPSVSSVSRHISGSSEKYVFSISSHQLARSRPMPFSSGRQCRGLLRCASPTTLLQSFDLLYLTSHKPRFCLGADSRAVAGACQWRTYTRSCFSSGAPRSKAAPPFPHRTTGSDRALLLSRAALVPLISCLHLETEEMPPVPVMMQTRQSSLNDARNSLVLLKSMVLTFTSQERHRHHAWLLRLGFIKL